MDKKRFEENRELTRQFPGDEAWREVRGRVAGGRRRRLIPRVAAALVLLLAVAAGIYLAREEAPAPGEGTPPFQSGTTGALLTLGDGREVSIGKETVLRVTEPDGTTIVVDSGGMDYLHPAAGTAGTLYNIVRTPTGMEFPVTLPDGTRVYLNAETRLRFPTRFAGESREVELEGEALFTVAPDDARPFTVRAREVEVRVTGTTFNLRAYENEATIAATLVEGRVILSRDDRQWPLAPGEQALLAPATGRCEIRAVDVDLYTAWQSGKFVFRNERLEDILSYLSRWYGFAYRFDDERAREVEIGTSLDRYSNMQPIIDILRASRLVEVEHAGDTLVIRSSTR
jgi:ferric-dicitrate binding protein FerR (iron transport regulator)